IPQIACTLPVAAASDCVPIARRIHALPAVIGCGQQIVGPEELLHRIVNKNGVVSHGSAIVVEIVRTFRVGVIRAAVDGQISPAVNRELVLVEMLMLGEVRAAIEFDPGRVLVPAISHYQMPNPSKVSLAWQFALFSQSGITWCDLGVIPEKFQYR